MGSEEQVSSLIDLIDSSLVELECLDGRLGKYDELLQVSIQDLVGNYHGRVDREPVFLLCNLGCGSFVWLYVNLGVVSLT